MKVKVKDKILDVPNEILEDKNLILDVISDIIALKILGIDQSIIEEFLLPVYKRKYKSYSEDIVHVIIAYVYKKYKNKIPLDQDILTFLVTESMDDEELYNILTKVLDKLIRYVKGIYISIIILIDEYVRIVDKHSLYLLKVDSFPFLFFDFIEKRYNDVLNSSKKVFNIDFKYLYDNQNEIMISLKFLKNTFQKIRNSVLVNDYKTAFNTLFVYYIERTKHSIIKKLLKIDTKYKLKAIIIDDYMPCYDFNFSIFLGSIPIKVQSLLKLPFQTTLGPWSPHSPR